MDLDSLIQTMSGDPALIIKNATRYIHFIGLALGLGAATVLDLMLLRFFVKKKITHENWLIIDFGAKIVNAGLVLLWATGVAFLIQYAFLDPSKLMNEKIWAKLAIVVVLTVNGAFIHGVVMPRIKVQIGRTLFTGMSRFQKSAFIVSGAISATSWYLPAALGAFTQFNMAPAYAILLFYAALLMVMTVAMHGVMWVMAPAETGSFRPSHSLPRYQPGLSWL